MRPIILQGHTRSLTQIKYNTDGDLLFSVSKDHVVNVWYSHNGERLGTYHGHNGALWSVDVTADSSMIATGSADNTMKLWNTQKGECLFTWTFSTAIKRVEFSENDDQLLCVTEERMGHTGTITVFPFINSLTATQTSEPSLVIKTIDSKVTVAGWSFCNKYIIAGHEDGSVSQYDSKTGELLKRVNHHEVGLPITDLQFYPDRSYFITSSKDKTARVMDSETLDLMKTFVNDAPVNSAAFIPKSALSILGGGQDARDVTTTSARQGHFEARFMHMIFEKELGRIRGHFGPLNTVAVHPDGSAYASGGEDGFIRMHHFDKGALDSF